MVNSFDCTEITHTFDISVFSIRKYHFRYSEIRKINGQFYRTWKWLCVL